MKIAYMYLLLGKKVHVLFYPKTATIPRGSKVEGPGYCYEGQ